MGSLWQDTCKQPAFPRLQQDTDTDVLIIGGGMAGVLCAHMLHHAGVDSLLVEADSLGGGVTGNTTAKLTVQHGLIYSKLVDRFGWKKAVDYYRANREALDYYRALCQKIDCGYEERSSFVYSRTDPAKLTREANILEKLGVPAEVTAKTELPFPVAGAVRMAGQAQFHPLQFLAAVSKDLHIYTHTPVRQLVGTTAITDSGRIRAKRVVIATHFPILNKHGSYFLKMYQHRSYVLALEGAQPLQGMYVDESKTGLSFRSTGDLLLLGGGGHRTGKQGGAYRELEAFAAQFYPQARIQYRWATQDCMTLDDVPYVGPYSAGTQGLYVTAGFNKWGMTGSMAAAMVLRELLTGGKSPYGDLFSPFRSVLRPQLAVNGAEALMSWLTPTSRRCPHMGCALKWNPQEHTWDCPCHGSRFTEDGCLLENPATGDLPKHP